MRYVIFRLTFVGMNAGTFYSKAIRIIFYKKNTNHNSTEISVVTGIPIFADFTALCD